MKTCECERGPITHKILIVATPDGTILDEVAEACGLCVIETFRPGALATVTEEELKK